MPSTSEAFRPASSMALRTAHVPSARVVMPEPRIYVVSPTPTMAYLSRRYFGLVVSVSAGIVMTVPPWLSGAYPALRSLGGGGPPSAPRFLQIAAPPAFL